MSFKPVYNADAAQINTDIPARIVRDWIQTNWAVVGIPANKVDWAFLGEQYSWEGKTFVISAYSDPPQRKDAEISPNSKEIRQRVILDIWVMDLNAFVSGKWPDSIVKIMKWLQNYIDMNPSGLQNYGIGVVEYETENFVEFGSTSKKNWFHANVMLNLEWFLVRS